MLRIFSITLFFQLVKSYLSFGIEEDFVEEVLEYDRFLFGLLFGFFDGRSHSAPPRLMMRKMLTLRI